MFAESNTICTFDYQTEHKSNKIERIKKIIDYIKLLTSLKNRNFARYYIINVTKERNRKV